jgi:hypothetical protein
MTIKSTYLTLSIIQSIELSSFGTSSGLSAILPALVSVIAAGSVIIAFLGTPGDFQPIFAASAGGLTAAIVLALGSRLFRNPAMIVWLSPLLILAGSVGGTLLVAEQAEIDPILLLGNAQALGAAEAVLRFVLCLAVIAVLAITCTSPGWSHALAVFSISGPSLILFFSLHSRLDANLHEGVAEKFQWYMFLGEITFIGVSSYLIFRWLLLERYHAHFSQCAISNALKLDSPSSTDWALRLIDGWIDPFRLVEKALGLQEEASSNQDSLTEAYTILTQRTKVLNLRTRSWLSLNADEMPETLILLAEDELIRKQSQAAASRISELALAILGEPTRRWIADTVLKIFEKRGLSIPVLADALRIVKLAVEATSLLKLEGGKEFDAKLCAFFGNMAGTLPESIRAKLNEGTHSWHKAQLMLAEDDFRCARFADGLIHLTRILSSDEESSRWIPSVVVDAWAKYSRETNSAVQQTLWEIFQSGSGNGVPAYHSLAILILENGLRTELPERLDGTKMAETVGGERAAAFLRVCDELYLGNLRAALPNFITAVSAVPHGLERFKFLPIVAEIAKREDNCLVRFFHEDSRSQLMEILEAPPTWIYGGRIACWSFLSADRDQVAFETTGHGPPQICTRFSAVINNLAHERNCNSDLILAGASFFDLRDRPSHRLSSDTALGGGELSENDLKERAHKLATKLGVKDILNDPDISFKELAERVSRPSIERTLNSLQQIETEMGLVEHHVMNESCRESVLEGLASGCPAAATEPFPVLLPYRVEGKRLRLRLPLICFGAEEYEEVVEEYRRSTLAEMRQEWIRRLETHEKWCGNFVELYLQLRSKGEEILKKSTIYIQYEINDITLTRKRLAPPRPESEFNYLAELPGWILMELGYWAWADYSLELLQKEESEFKPHWEQNLLIDAFLRNYPMSVGNPRLNAALEKWQRNWRPLVLLMLGDCLRLQGMTLADIALENTVFRVVDQDETSLVLEPSHIWDACKDPAPRELAGKTVFAPHFGSRRRVTLPALETQKNALKMLNKSLIEPIQRAGLRQCLKLDSGAVLDKLVATACEGLNRPDDLAEEMARVLALAQQKLEPVPDCLQGRDRVCYDFAEGDAALALALAMGEHRHLRDEAQLRELIGFLSTCEIQRPFRALDKLCNKLIYDLKQFLSKSASVTLDDLADKAIIDANQLLSQNNHVTLKLFADKEIDDACAIMLDKSEECYMHAALIDGEFGSSCLSLARLKWQRGRFREALSQLFGPVPKADLDACQLPLSVGVRIAGGKLAIKTDDTMGTWQDPKGLSFAVSREEHVGLILKVHGAGSCQISGLNPKDIDLLAEFFGKFEPASCRSLDNGSFSEWLRLLKIPNLGMRGALAAALGGDMERSVLAACIYLTPPDVLILPPGKFRGRSGDLLAQEVVTSLEWGPG